MTDLAILGGGITGLAAAYFLRDQLSCLVLESSEQVGGVIQTTQSGSFLLEHGPDCFMNQKPWGLDLALELGLKNQLIESKDYQRRVLVLENGQFKISDHQDKAVTEFLGNRATAGVNPNAFLSFKHGMQTWPNALASALGDRVLLNQRATKIDWDKKLITCASGLQVQAKAILLTLPAYESARLLGTIWPQFKTTQTACVYLAYKRDAIEHPLDAFGLIIPAAENRKISALTFVSSKFDNRCPEDFVLFRAFLKGDFSSARFEIEQLLQPQSAPILEHGMRLTYADPKYTPDHFEQVEKLEQSLPPGVFISGSPYRGVGIADCVHQAKQASENILNFF
jgi:protoporphyrinogen oxidase